MAKPELAEIRRTLARGRNDDAASLATGALAGGAMLRPLERVFESAGRLALLSDVVWDDKETFLASLSRVADYIELCKKAEKPERIDAMLDWLSGPKTPLVTVGHRDFMSRFKLDDRRVQRMLAIKYRGWNDDPSASLMTRATALAQRCELESAVLDAVIRQTCPGGASQSWRDCLYLAQACGHAMRDATTAYQLLGRAKDDSGDFLKAFYKSVSSGPMLDIVDMSRWHGGFAPVAPLGGLVVATYHNLCARLAVSAFERMLPSSFTIRQKDLSDPAASRNTAFRALKTVMAQNTILIAPDGSRSAQSSQVDINVLGQTDRVSVGPALIAYEGNADSVFYCAYLAEDGFRPLFIAGPKRETGESFNRFRDRWLAFYVGAMETALLASPADLAFFLRPAKK